MRLQVLALGALVGGAVVLLAACGGQESPTPTTPTPAAAPAAKTGDAAIASLVATDEAAAETPAPAPVAVDPVSSTETAAEAEASAQPAPAPAPVQVAAAATGGGTPRIVVENPIYDFGRMETGEKREHEWVVRNAGDADLIITSVRPSCGCTNTAMTDDVIPPGGRTTLKSVLDLPRQVGPVRKNIAISSNDPQQATVVVAFVGEATQAIVVDPQVVTFQNVDRNEEKSITADVKATEDGVTFNITELVMSDGGPFDASYETIEEGRHYRVTVSTRPPMSGNHLSDRIVIETDNPRVSNLNLTVVAVVLTDIITAPEVIRLSSLHTDPLKRMILLRAGRVQNFNITDVTLPDPEMTYTVTERQPGMLYVEVGNIVARPELDGTEIIVHTDAPSVPEVRVPIVVVGAGGGTTPGLSAVSAPSPEAR